MTEDAARAKRLYDTKQWSDAAFFLKFVVDGKTGDDAGNRQIAIYYLAITLYQMNRFDESLAIFVSIARDPTHHHHHDVLSWLVKLAKVGGECADIANAAIHRNYGREDGSRSDGSTK